MQTSKDERLWRIARKRAGFRKSLFSFLVVIAFLWAIWWLTTGRHTGLTGRPWPVWVMLAWGVALGFQYFDAYNGTKDELAEQEYEKLKRDQQL